MESSSPVQINVIEQLVFFFSVFIKVLLSSKKDKMLKKKRLTQVQAKLEFIKM